MIYDGLVYGESKVILQKGNTHNLNGGGADEIDGKCNCLEKWQLSNGIPGVGVAHGLKASSLVGLALFFSEEGEGWFCSFGLGPRNGSSARRETTADKMGWPDFLRVQLAGGGLGVVSALCLGLISAPGAGSSPGGSTFLALPALQLSRADSWDW